MKKRAQHGKVDKSLRNLVEEKDWSLTPLGPRENWPIELEVAVTIMLEAEEAIGIYWGKDLILLYNDLAREQIGKKHPEALGRPAHEIFPETWKTLGPIHEQIMAGKEPVRLEEKYLPLKRNGVLEDIWWNSSFSPIPLADGSVGGVLKISVDISARKKAELKREQFLLTLSDAMRSLSDPIQIQKEAARIAGEHLHLDRAQYGEMLADENTNIVYADYHKEGLNSLVGKHQLNDFGPYIRENFLAGNTIVINDFSTIEELSDAEREMYKKTNITAWVGVPLLKEDSLRAYFVVNQSKPRHWKSFEVQLIEETAERTWEAVGRARAKQSLHESEERLAADLANTALLRDFAERMVTEENIQTIYKDMLSAAITIAGADAGTIQIYDPKMDSLELIATLNFSSKVTDHFQYVNAGSRTACGIALKTGQRAFVNFSDEIADPGCRLLVNENFQSALAVPLMSRNDTPLGMLNTHWCEVGHHPTTRQLHFLDLLARQAADLMEQQLANKALHDSEERQKFLLELNDEFRTLSDPVKIQETAIHLLGTFLDSTMAFYYEYDPQTNVGMIKAEYRRDHGSNINGRFTFGDFPEIQKLLFDGLSVVVNDTKTDSRLSQAERDQHETLEFRSYMGVPFLKGGNLASVIVIGQFSSREWTENEVSILRETAERTWAAVERARAEKNLRESEKQLQMALNTAQLGSWELDVNTKIFSSSAICKAHFGRTPNDTLNYEDMIASIQPNDWKTNQKIMINALATGEEYEVEYRIKWPNGVKRWIYTRIRPINASTLSGTTLDITNRKETEKELEKRTKALQTSRMKLRSLVNELSRAEENERFILAGELHDNLGQILDACKLKLYVLIKNNSHNLPGSVHEIKDMIDEAIHCTRRLINDLKPTPTKEKEDLDSALKWVAGKMEKHGLSVTINNSDNIDAVDQRSLNTLLQAVQELLFNVVKHAETDQAWINIKQSNNFVEIKVKDKGQGFDPKEHKESTGQDGFGLFNVRQRIDLLGGTFSIKAKPGDGTTAILQIPLMEIGADEDKRQELKSTAKNGLLSSKNTAPISVLVVDDHKMMREGIAGIINAENGMYVTDQVSTGEKALRAVRKTQPDVVILDVNLPGMSGIETIKKIKLEYPNTRIICIAFHKDQKLINQIFSVGASDFISKDETLQSFCQAIRDAVN